MKTVFVSFFGFPFFLLDLVMKAVVRRMVMLSVVFMLMNTAVMVVISMVSPMLRVLILASCSVVSN